MNLKFWDSRARLIAALARLTDAEAREIIKKARPGYHLAKNQPGGKKKKDVSGNGSLI